MFLNLYDLVVIREKYNENCYNSVEVFEAVETIFAESDLIGAIIHFLRGLVRWIFHKHDDYKGEKGIFVRLSTSIAPNGTPKAWAHFLD